VVGEPVVYGPSPGARGSERPPYAALEWLAERGCFRQYARPERLPADPTSCPGEESGKGPSED